MPMGRSPKLAQVIMDDLRSLGVIDLSYVSFLGYVALGAAVKELAVNGRGHRAQNVWGPVPVLPGRC